MKDILITSKRQKSEMIWLVVCFCVAELINLTTIIVYGTSWSELYTQILWVLLFTVFLYAVSIAIRVCLYLIIKYRNPQKKVSG
jgi:uncharacterized membrane protein YbhN (UPF0104 family)